MVYVQGLVCGCTRRVGTQTDFSIIVLQRERGTKLRYGEAVICVNRDWFRIFRASACESTGVDNTRKLSSTCTANVFF